MDRLWIFIGLFIVCVIAAATLAVIQNIKEDDVDVGYDDETGDF